MLYTFAMGTSVIIRTPMPTAEQVADSLGLSQERRQFLKDLASTAKTKSKPRRKRAVKKAA
jgi:hypothetical protein